MSRVVLNPAGGERVTQFSWLCAPEWVACYLEGMSGEEKQQYGFTDRPGVRHTSIRFGISRFVLECKGWKYYSGDSRNSSNLGTL